MTTVLYIFFEWTSCSNSTLYFCSSWCYFVKKVIVCNVLDSVTVSCSPSFCGRGPDKTPFAARYPASSNFNPSYGE